MDDKPTSRFSEEDLLLLKTPDAELRQIHAAPSLDDSELLKRVGQGEAWQQIIQAHLFIDHIVTEMLKLSLLRPKAIQLTRLGFSQKLQLAFALGLIAEGPKSAVEIVTQLRNKVAHDLNFRISGGDVVRLRQVVMRALGDDERPLEFPELLVFLIYVLEVAWREQRYAKVLNRKAMLRAHATLYMRDNMPEIVQ